MVRGGSPLVPLPYFLCYGELHESIPRHLGAWGPQGQHLCPHCVWAGWASPGSCGPKAGWASAPSRLSGHSAQTRLPEPSEAAPDNWQEDGDSHLVLGWQVALPNHEQTLFECWGVFPFLSQSRQEPGGKGRAQPKPRFPPCTPLEGQALVLTARGLWAHSTPCSCRFHSEEMGGLAWCWC